MGFAWKFSFYKRYLKLDEDLLNRYPNGLVIFPVNPEDMDGWLYKPYLDSLDGLEGILKPNEIDQLLKDDLARTFFKKFDEYKQMGVGMMAVNSGVKWHSYTGPAFIATEIIPEDNQIKFRTVRKERIYPVMISGPWISKKKAMIGSLEINIHYIDKGEAIDMVEISKSNNPEEEIRTIIKNHLKG